MAGTTDFVPFATSAGANVESQANYVAASSTSNGYSSGAASSAFCNKSWRQATMGTAVIANFTANQLSINVADDGSLTNFLNNFTSALTSLINADATTVVNNALATLTLPFTRITGTAANAQIPSSAVTQYQGLLQIAGGQVTSPVAQANTVASNGGYATFHWSGQAGQPSWLWGSNDGVNFYVWNPSNFNVNAVQGYGPSTAASGNTLALRTAGGYLFSVYYNQSSGANENPTVSQVYVDNGDGYHRKAGLGYFINQLDPGASMAPNGYQRLPNGKILQWATVYAGDIPANGTVSAYAYFPLTFPNALEGWATDTQDGAGGLGSYVWNTTTVWTAGAEFGAHEIINVLQEVYFRIFAIGY